LSLDILFAFCGDVCEGLVLLEGRHCVEVARGLVHVNWRLTAHHMSRAGTILVFYNNVIRTIYITKLQG
jgi:hypothetical protein